jgi:hypothetical protein
MNSPFIPLEKIIPCAKLLNESLPFKLGTVAFSLFRGSEAAANSSWENEEAARIVAWLMNDDQYMSAMFARIDMVEQLLAEGKTGEQAAEVVLNRVVSCSK